MPELTFFLLRRWRLLLAALGLLALNGCASVYLVDNQVQSFARWDAARAPAAPQSYRFERLPSQSVGEGADAQDRLESLTRAALARVGWSLAEAAAPAPWTVQVSASTLRLPRAPWEDPRTGPWVGDGFWGGGHLFIGSGGGVWGSGFMRLDTPYYQRQVSLLIRQTGHGPVVFETRAAHDGVWHSTPELWSAMLDAALRDFPAPPSGTRQVNVEVPR